MFDRKIDDAEPTDSAWAPPMQSWRRPGRISITVIEGPESGRVFTLGNARTVVIGRSATADVVLDHPSVSVAHCELQLSRDSVDIHDLDSTNGTWIGQTQIHHAKIGPGAQLIVGDYTLAVGAVEKIEVPIWSNNHLGEMLGQSRLMREVFAHIVNVAETPLGVLITGETGTGKELVARAIHGASDRAEQPWVVWDCAAQAPSLIEASLFGYERGAFTGADTSKAGLVQAANGGTLFLDEVGELPLGAQLRLLRVLDRQEITPVGATASRKVDVRVIAATNRNLHQEIATGGFREDLYFRLTRSRIELPPLRQREGDALFLGEHVLASVAAKRGVELRFSDDAKRTLASRYWKGNVRELRNEVESQAYLAVGPEVEIRPKRTRAPELNIGELATLPYDPAHTEFDKEYLRAVMDRAGGSQRAAARLLGIGRNRLRKKLKAAGLAVIDEEADDE